MKRLLVLMLISAAAAGCSTNDSAEQLGAGEANEQSPTSNQTQEIGESTTEPSIDESGVASGVDNGGVEIDEPPTDRAVIEQLQEAETEVALCMNAAGFDYTPYISDLAIEEFGLEEEAPTETPLGGLPRSREEAERVGLQISLALDASPLQNREPEVNPNNVYANSLTDEAREVYYTTLFGLEPEEGCVGIAYADVLQLLTELEPEDAFPEEASEADLTERFLSMPSVIAAEKAALDCMKAEGHEFEAIDDVYTAVVERLTGYEDLRADYEIDITEGLAPTTDPRELDNLLAEIQDYEIQLAIALFGCSGDLRDEFDQFVSEVQSG